MRTFSLPVVALGALLASGAVCADHHHHHGCKDCPHPSFASFDTDADGKLSSAEYYAGRGQRMADRAAEGGKMKNAENMPTFEDIDTDGDGVLSPEEFDAHVAAQQEKNRGKQR
jgi:hypothetical protein